MEEAGDREKKIVLDGLIQGQELTGQLRSRFIPSSPADVLTQNILSSFNSALCILNSGDSCGGSQITGGVDSSDYARESLHSSNFPYPDPECRDPSNKSRKLQPKWTEKVRISSGTSLEGPLDDGNNWRKYGQKDILGAKYPRAYYRCTHRNTQGCMAKKQVQRSDTDPSLFYINYHGVHTCCEAQAKHNSPKSAKRKQQQQQQQQNQQLLNFQTGLAMETHDMDSYGYSSSSFPQDLAGDAAFHLFPNTFNDSPYSETMHPPSMHPYFSMTPSPYINGGGSVAFDDQVDEPTAFAFGYDSSLVDLELNLNHFDTSSLLLD